MKKNVLTHRPNRHLTDLLVALTLVERQVTRVAGVEHNPLGMLVHSAPVVYRLQQLLAVMLTLELWVNTQQWQDMH